MINVPYHFNEQELGAMKAVVEIWKRERAWQSHRGERGVYPRKQMRKSLDYAVPAFGNDFFGRRLEVSVVMSEQALS